MDLQRNLEANVEKRTKETYGPPMGKRLLVFMDDMNMPKVPSVLQALSQVSGVLYCDHSTCAVYVIFLNVLCLFRWIVMALSSLLRF